MAYDDWTDEEVELTVADYFTMLKFDLSGIKYNKTVHRKALLPLLRGRSEGAIEFKHQNISAVLVDLGLPFIRGYKPLFNIQKTKLNVIVSKHVDRDHSLVPLFLDFSERVPAIPAVDFANWVAPAPLAQERPKRQNDFWQPRQINYLEREQANTRLGVRGEELVVAYERYRLSQAGKVGLADQVEWVSRDKGDGLGFDILSREVSGQDRLIEVKTTKLAKETPFFFSAREFDCSIIHESRYHLYRIYDIGRITGLFMLQGRYDKFCRMEPVSYVGRV
ncbi:DUF3883 domain-containing protein [Mucilaginibacter myungsuensis]|uniref:DUF3883 domain-containing protein n=1 Tax=Mucilaginibacter myungsuensis TaxID=649104 RepID=A0A929KZ21_9SPHI|nr:DUF3883 domain-containing protein [Mucilaginibacter myungsuensis]MBE9663088.1 DUF3883 domain-containing protein [Mucilaginibacter myungsuensis]MDN3598723.1 DUF3883 domain-containing protein [Mucilaginibacter myungsuensis]